MASRRAESLSPSLRMAPDAQVYREEQVPVVKEYLEHLATLDQLLCISTELRDDVAKGRHKYAAHKIALLYHAINSSKLSRDVLRKRIEEHFEDVKEATETHEAPHLSDELTTWIIVCATCHDAKIEGRRVLERTFAQCLSCPHLRKKAH